MVIVGAGGHGVEVFEIARNMNFNCPIAVFDNVNTSIANVFLRNDCVILNDFKSLKLWLELHPKFSIATGNPRVRSTLFEKVKDYGGEAVSVIASTSYNSNLEVEIGAGCNIMHNVFISSRVKIGINSLINCGTSISHDSIIGKNCEIGPGVRVLGSVTVGDNVFIGSNSVILSNVKIMSNVIIGAGSIVTKSIIDEGVYFGSPAIYRRGLKS